MESLETPAEPTPEAAATPSTVSAVSPGGSLPGDDLPEWEPLSPELLEDEAIRGDFVLRWAVVGLALLLGCAQLSDARPLVHVRSGDWLLAHGVLPGGNDPFSIAAADRRWVNLNWAFDLIAAGVHAVSGPVGLSVLQGVLALVAWALLGHACRSGIRTWWGSVCATLALITAMPRLNATPELITLCGAAIVLWLLVRCEERRASWWAFVPVLWVWSQMDPRAWMGAALLVLYLLGAWLSRRSATTSVQAIWQPVVAAVAVMLIHPFLWEPWLAPFSLYGVEYPALRAAYQRPTVFDPAWHPLWSPLVWRQIDFRILTGLFLAAAATAALILDRARATWSHGWLFLGANAIGVATLHDFPFAACVNCMLATVHAQSWYLARFGQVYTVAWPEVLFSRGGRALTVFGLSAVAWLAISGRIDGPDGRRSGVGLDRQLQAEFDSYRQLSTLTADLNGFNLTLRQGDALIAAGRKSFVDHRVRLFAGSGDRHLLARHDKARRSLRTHQAAPPSTPEWKELFAAFHISHVLPRLTQGVSGPDYETLFDLLSQRDWSLTELLPSTAVLHWESSPETPVRQFAAEHALNVLDKAFRKPPAVREQPHDHPVPPNWSQQMFSMPRRQLGGSTSLATHWMRLATAVPAVWTFRAACLTLAVRSAQAGVLETPDVPAAYGALAQAYALLGQVEAGPLSETGMPWETSLRYYQAVAAAQDALRLNPGEISPHLLLLDLYRSARRIDAAHAEALYLVEHSTVADPTDAAAVAQRDSLLQLEEALNRDAQRLSDRAQQQLDQGTERLQVASALYQSGAIRRAASILRDDSVYVERNPAARQLLTAALAELGAGSELDESAKRLDFVAEPASLPRWRDLMALAALGRADYVEALSQWDRQLLKGEGDQLQSLLYTAPLATSSPFWLGDMGFPPSHAVMVLEAVERRPYDQALVDLNRAACEIERAKTEEAAKAMRRALHRAPASPLRPLLRLYLYCLTGELADAEPPADWIPIHADLFATED